MWDTENRNTYDDVPPPFSAARDNENWGHCELDFIDTSTVEVTINIVMATGNIVIN